MFNFLIFRFICSERGKFCFWREIFDLIYYYRSMNQITKMSSTKTNKINILTNHPLLIHGNGKILPDIKVNKKVKPLSILGFCNGWKYSPSYGMRSFIDYLSSSLIWNNAFKIIKFSLDSIIQKIQQCLRYISKRSLQLSWLQY